MWEVNRMQSMKMLGSTLITALGTLFFMRAAPAEMAKGSEANQ